MTLYHFPLLTMIFVHTWNENRTGPKINLVAKAAQVQLSDFLANKVISKSVLVKIQCSHSQLAKNTPTKVNMCLQHKNFSIWFYYSFHYTVVENHEKSFICYVIHTVGENHTQLCIQMSLPASFPYYYAEDDNRCEEKIQSYIVHILE